MVNLQEMIKNARLNPIQRSRILIVDDEIDICEYLQRCLAHFGHQNTRICSGAEQAMDIMDDEDFALALIDLRMPGQGGLWLLQQIREYHSDTAVLVISASRDFHDVKKALNHGAESYISKPVQMDELNHTVKNVLEKRYLTRDPASSLPNRTALVEALSAVRDDESHRFEGLAIVLIDRADELESVYGPSVADEIIKQLGARIRQVPGNSIVCRINTYQLGFLLRDMGDKSVIKRLRGLAETFKKTIDFAGIPLHIDGRIGYSSFKDAEINPELHIREAEFALRRASVSNREWVVFDSSQHSANLSKARESLDMLNEFEKAMGEGQLSFAYQPRISLADGTLCGMEALIRWQHPVRGYIPPDKFISRLEQSTYIHSLTKFAVKKVLGQIKYLEAKGITTPVSVNISVHNLFQSDFPDMIAGCLESFGVKGGMLELEITERALISDIDYITGVLEKLASMGITISIDDFGTVYSSLNYLVNLPSDIIKLDQSFVQTLNTKKGSARVVEIATDLAHHLGKKVVAEGVEDTETLKFIADTGCDMAQGFLLARPQLPDEIVEWHTKHQAKLSGWNRTLS